VRANNGPHRGARARALHQSAEFRTRWAAHNVRFHDTGIKDLHHPVVGDITLTYNRMELAADPGQMLMISTAEPGSKSAEALSLLGSGAATPQQPALQEAPDHP
jgi:MmyB-like transcription regulator ligand binding domain